MPERCSPGFGSLSSIGGSDESHTGNRTQRAELLDWLMRRTILAESDRVMRVDVDDMPLHYARQSYRRSHVVGENQEGRTVGNNPAE